MSALAAKGTLRGTRARPAHREFLAIEAASGRSMLTLQSRIHPPKNGGMVRHMEPNLAAEWAPCTREKRALVSERDDPALLPSSATAFLRSCSRWRYQARHLVIPQWRIEMPETVGADEAV